MKYTKIDNPDDVAAQSLKSEATQKEELAFSQECGAAEYDALALRKLNDGTGHDAQNEQAAQYRREADVYVKMAGLSDEEIKQIHEGYLHRWIEHIERQHIHHSAILKVRAELGEPTASYDSILSGLDVSHDLAQKKLSELTGQPAPSPRRTAPRRKK